MAAIEQRKSYRCLELLDALRDGGLGGVQLRCGALECAELRDPVESFQLLKSTHPAFYVFQGTPSLVARSVSHSQKRRFIILIIRFRKGQLMGTFWGRYTPTR